MKFLVLFAGLLFGVATAQTTQTVPITVTIPAPIPGPAGANGVPGAIGPAGPQGPIGAPGPAGTSPSAASVAAALAATPSFVAAVAAVVGTPTCGSVPASTTATISCPAGFTGSWTQTTSYASTAAPACWTPVLSPTSAPTLACVPVVTPPPLGTAVRPSVNTGGGFFVLNGKLYDANGHEFRIRGVNKNFDDGQPGYALSGANAVRYFLYGKDTTAHVTSQLASYVGFKQVPIYSMYTFPDGTKSTGNTSAAELAAGAAYWATLAPQLKPYEKYLILNIANEWGPIASANNTVWRDAYIAAIKTLRAAGINATLMVDAANYGQDYGTLQLHAAAVFASDSQANTVFSFHAYGGVTTLQSVVGSVAKGTQTVITLNSSAAIHPLAPGFNGTNNSWTPVTGVQISGVTGMTQLNGVWPILPNVGGKPGAWTVTALVNSSAFTGTATGGTIYDAGNYQAVIPRLAALSSQGVCVVIGEFGPGNNIGPSPTVVTPDQIVSTAEASGIGWMPWAWDNNNLANGTSDNNGFSMTTAGPGIYTGLPSQLTAYGADMVAWYSKVAKVATIF